MEKVQSPEISPELLQQNPLVGLLLPVCIPNALFAVGGRSVSKLGFLDRSCFPRKARTGRGALEASRVGLSGPHRHSAMIFFLANPVCRPGRKVSRH